MRRRGKPGENRGHGRQLAEQSRRHECKSSLNTLIKWKVTGEIVGTKIHRHDSIGHKPQVIDGGFWLLQTDRSFDRQIGKSNDWRL
jgi:hypothetical protein